MDITVYLPDELGRWAKNTRINLSATLREALDAERQRQNAMAKTLEGPVVHELLVDHPSGARDVRLHGQLIAIDKGGKITAFLTEDRRVFVYDDKNRLHELDDPADPAYADEGGKGLRAWLDDDDVYVQAMAAIGERAIIDIGQD